MYSFSQSKGILSGGIWGGTSKAKFLVFSLYAASTFGIPGSRLETCLLFSSAGRKGSENITSTAGICSITFGSRASPQMNLTLLSPYIAQFCFAYSIFFGSISTAYTNPHCCAKKTVCPPIPQLISARVFALRRCAL